MRDRSIGDRRQIGRTSRLNAAQELKTLIHWLVGFVVFKIFDLLTNDCNLLNLLMKNDPLLY